MFRKRFNKHRKLRTLSRKFQKSTGFVYPTECLNGIPEYFIKSILLHKRPSGVPLLTDAGSKLCRFILMKMPAANQLALTQTEETNRILERLIKTVQMTMTSESSFGT